ncbi:hypothetical protein KA025_02465 [Candidatus Saccharibacteria bacterium]|nr:hypothetical protein [Candidatus Saccharibacteria bacterium]
MLIALVFSSLYMAVISCHS